jgi:adenosylcobyric acid synthase
MNDQRTPCLMVQGCTSDAGKSVLVTALCRILHRRGIRVAPFKPQNMALNSAVTVDGGEIGRAQALQALAAGLSAHTDFNPVLLKPATDRRAQVIVHGKALRDLDARDYHAYKPLAMQAVLASWQRLCGQYECLLVEGAGSPAEINLRDRDIANMGFAEAVDCPVILIADIDRGGVFAHLCGTLDLLSESEQARVKGFVINRFRGDVGLLESGLRWLERRTGKPVLGVLPYLHGLYLDAEDAVPREARAQECDRAARHRPGLPENLESQRPRPAALSPGSRFSLRRGERAAAALRTDRPAGIEGGAVRPRLAARPGLGRGDSPAPALRRQSDRHLRRPADARPPTARPTWARRPSGQHAGAWLAGLRNAAGREKTLQNVSGELLLPGAASVSGYRIHMGVTEGAALATPALRLAGRRTARCRRWPDSGHLLPRPLRLASRAGRAADLGRPPARQEFDAQQRREADIDRLADAVEAHLDLRQLAAWLPAQALLAAPRTAQLDRS